MAKKSKFYVTTPIYYPSAKPHLGSAYTTIAADIVARFHKLREEKVFFLTGTDEHTKKVIKEAEKLNISPKQFTDLIVPEFKKSWEKLNITYDRFIRTSDEDHKKLVEYILKKAYDKGEIYLGTYEGLYCVNCEAYYTEKDADNGNCPIHKKPLEYLKEESYFFKLSKYQKELLELYEKNPDFISPSFRKNEIINRVKEGLKDLSISRKNQSWGIKLPFDNSHVSYVWYDALTNYLTGIGMLEDKKMFKTFWPADVHLVGKDILWFHSVIWPAMLFSSDIAQPKKVFAHGWLTVKGNKIGKSAGNAVDLNYLIEKFGVDTIRYFLFRHFPFGSDGEYEEQDLIDRHNNELANKLGNLVSRVTTLAEKYGLEKKENSLLEKLNLKEIEKYIENYEFDKALNEIFSFIDKCNEYVQDKKPWETHDKKVLYELIDSIKSISILLYPFMPTTSEKIALQLSFDITYKQLLEPIKIKEIKKGDILFKKI